LVLAPTSLVMLQKITLNALGGGLAGHCEILPFVERPSAVCWGTRFFFDTGADDDDGLPIYAEEFVAYAIPPMESLDARVARWEESVRLHREYNDLVTAQLAGAKNGAEVVRLTDECSTKGIILVPGGDNAPRPD
jgi:hypothetical protein